MARNAVSAYGHPSKRVYNETFKTWIDVEVPATTTVLNFYGGPGAGKSTTAMGVATILKLAGKKVEYVSEVAKDMVWDNARHQIRCTPYVLCSQYQKLHRLMYHGVEYAVTDSPLLLAPIYDELNRGCRSEEYLSFAKFLRRDFMNIDVLLTRDKEAHPYQEYGRNQTEEEAIAIDEAVRSLLEEHGSDRNFYQINVMQDFNLRCRLLAELAILTRESPERLPEFQEMLKRTEGGEQGDV